MSKSSSPRSPRSSLSNKNNNNINANFDPGHQIENSKVILLGDSGVGKTSILLKYVENKVNEEYSATLGVDFFLKNFDIDGIKYRLMIWDTAGQERYKSVGHAYMKGVNILLLVYDVTKISSFENLDTWYQIFMEKSGSNTEDQNDVCIAVIGNKVDLNFEREISQEQGMEKAKELGAIYGETSVKIDDANIDTVFNGLVQELASKRLIRKKKENGMKKNSLNFKLGDEKNDEQKLCTTCCI